jgi:3-isopropylmalate/(R)-2-methylmalate dehydratase small subunit
LDYGFKAVISSFFADIFKNNSLNNGLLPVTVSQAFLDKAMKEIETNPKAEVTIDLEKQTISMPSINMSETFPIDPYKKTCLLNGYSDIDYVLSLKDKIISYENNRKHE